MINILEYKVGYTERVINLILPIQQTEFGIPVTIADQPDLNDIPGFLSKRDWQFLDGNRR